jgi:hypothetical protein
MNKILKQIEEQVERPVRNAVERLDKIKEANDADLRGLQLAAINELDDGLRFVLNVHLSKLKNELDPQRKKQFEELTRKIKGSATEGTEDTE